MEVFLTATLTAAITGIFAVIVAIVTPWARNRWSDEEPTDDNSDREMQKDLSEIDGGVDVTPTPRHDTISATWLLGNVVVPRLKRYQFWEISLSVGYLVVYFLLLGVFLLVISPILTEILEILDFSPLAIFLISTTVNLLIYWFFFWKFLLVNIMNKLEPSLWKRTMQSINLQFIELHLQWSDIGALVIYTEDPRNLQKFGGKTVQNNIREFANVWRRKYNSIARRPL